jgi:hypothetical protein
MASENGVEDHQFLEDSQREEVSGKNGIEEEAVEGANMNGSLNGNGHMHAADANGKSSEQDAKKNSGGLKEEANSVNGDIAEAPAEKEGGGDVEMADADEKVFSIFNLIHDNAHISARPAPSMHNPMWRCDSI